MGGKPSVPEERIPPERTFVVTGGNTGIGYETAKKIAQLGGRVIIACRSEERATDAIRRMKEDTETELSQKNTTDKTDAMPDLNVKYMNLDLASLESTATFARQYKESGLPLHVLICNAGLGVNRKILTEDGFEIHFQVNYLSHFLLTILLLPLLKESAPSSRIVNVSSVAHTWLTEVNLDNIQAQKSFNLMKFYGNSKLFQIMNMHSLSRKIEGSGISIFSLHPGFVDTEIFRRAKGPRKVFFDVLKFFGSVDPARGATTSLIAALDPMYDGKTALYFTDGKPRSSNALSGNIAMQDVLWKYSLQCLKGNLGDANLQEIGEKLEDIENLENIDQTDDTKKNIGGENGEIVTKLYHSIFHVTQGRNQICQSRKGALLEGGEC